MARFKKGRTNRRRCKAIKCDGELCGRLAMTRYGLSVCGAHRERQRGSERAEAPEGGRRSGIVQSTPLPNARTVAASRARSARPHCHAAICSGVIGSTAPKGGLVVCYRHGQVAAADPTCSDLAVAFLCLTRRAEAFCFPFRLRPRTAITKVSLPGLVMWHGRPRITIPSTIIFAIPYAVARAHARTVNPTPPRQSRPYPQRCQWRYERQWTVSATAI